MNWKKVRAPVLVGFVLMAGLASLTYMITTVEDSTFDPENSYLIYAIFEDVTGLVEDGTVSMVGIPVGTISKIERVTTEQGVRARVSLRVSGDVTLYAGERDEQGRLLGAATVTRRQLSILGDYYLTLTPGAFGPRLQPEDEIPIVIGVSGMDALFEQASQIQDIYPKLDRIATNVEELTEGLAIALGGKEGGKSLGKIVGNLEEVSGELKSIAKDTRVLTEEINGLVEGGTIRDIAENVRATTSDARDIAEKLEAIVSAGEVEQLVTNLAETSKQLNELGVQVGEIMDKGITPRLTQLARIFRNFERFSGDLAGFSGEHRKTLGETMDNMRVFSKQLVGLVQRSKGEVETAMGSFKGTMTSAQVTLGKLDDTLENLRNITADVREGKGSIGRLLTDDKLVEEVEEIITDTKDFIKSYTLMQTEVQLASSWFVQTNSFKNVLSLRFRPREDKYYLLQVIDDPRGHTTNEMVVTQSSATGLETERIEKTSHSLKFSFQFAKAYHFITGRFGIMENTGGIGIDFTFFQNRLQFQFDLFDFTMNTNPRLRGQVEWEIMQHLFVAGGADDVLNPAYRDYFFSLGIRFTDKDLKALLFAAPSISP